MVSVRGRLVPVVPERRKGQGISMRRLNNRRRFAGMLLAVLFTVVGACSPQLCPCKPDGDPERGATLFASGDGTGPACQSCHCPDADGGCRLLAPSVQGKTYEAIHGRTRDTSVQHPGGKFDFTAQDVADLEAYLAALD